MTGTGVPWVVEMSLGTSWRAGENFGSTAEHRRAPATSLGALTTSLGAPRITVEQSVKNIIVFGNAAGAPGNHSYYLSFNDF